MTFRAAWTAPTPRPASAPEPPRASTTRSSGRTAFPSSASSPVIRVTPGVRRNSAYTAARMSSCSAAEEPPAGSDHCQALKSLHAELEQRGLLAHSHFWRWKLGTWVPAFFASYFALLVLPFGPLWLMLLPLAAVAQLTMGYVGHDAGHYALSKRPWINDVWGHFGMTFLCGMSFGFWRSRHNRHHA